MSNRDGGNVAFEIPQGDAAEILIASNPGTVGSTSCGRGWLMSKPDGGNVAFEMPQKDAEPILIASNPGTISLSSW